MAIPTPPPPPDEAAEYFRRKDLRPAFDYRDVWREEHRTAFMVAKVTEADVLASIQASLQHSLDTGGTFEGWKKLIRPELQRAGWWGKRDVVDPLTGEVKTTDLSSPHRLRTIYDTNMRQARSAGQWERIQRTKQQLPYLLYEIGPSIEHRAEHVSWHGTILPADHVWWSTHMPINGWGCNCGVRQVGRVEYQRLLRDGVPTQGAMEFDGKTGLPTGHRLRDKVTAKTEPPPTKLKPWKNKRTGQTEYVPEGIDPGFDYNPGIQRSGAGDRIVETKRPSLPPAVADQVDKVTGVTPTPPSPAAASTRKRDRPKLESLDDWIEAGAEIQATTVPPDATQRQILDALAVHRPVSKPINVVGSGPAASKVKKASKMLPDDWVAASERQGPLAVKAVPGRSGYRSLPGGGGGITLRESAHVEIALHELVHRMQAVMPGLDKLFQDLHKRRTAFDPVVSIYAGTTETGRPDGYFSAYQGREYAFSNSNGPALEVMTMAFQAAIGGDAQELQLLRERDPEMLRLVLAALWWFVP